LRAAVRIACPARSGQQGAVRQAGQRVARGEVLDARLGLLRAVTSAAVPR